MAGLFDETDEVEVIFPVPGEAEVIVHGDIVKDDLRIKKEKGLYADDVTQFLRSMSPERARETLAGTMSRAAA
ncbi:MAG: hypothetical protein OHK0041_06840 [Anaerolineales bacterium]